ncbi:MAG: hypothetical protein A2Y24_06100 [Clostridiales bacterium GWE2_32_10]|nr:MAG: hypothetical protein A2Y24_06100 [Clostridiales bacterium GWE2_32_10]
MKKVIFLSVVFLCMFQSFSYAQQFSDLPYGHWAYDGVSSMSTEGIIAGYPDNTFKPSELVTREQFAKIMVLALKQELNYPGTPSFRDVSKTNWSYGYVETAKKYLSGYETGNENYFKPAESPTRLDVAIALIKALGYENQNHTNDISIFKDYTQIPQEQRKYVAIAVEKNIMKGYEDNTFRPQGKLNRAEAATLIYRLIAKNSSDPIEQEETPNATDNPIIKSIPYNVSCMLKNPKTSVIYILSKENKVLEALDYDKKQTIGTLTFDKMSERMDINKEGTEIYVTLLDKEHQYVWNEEEQTGTIAIIDTKTLKIKSYITLTIDPFDVAVGDNGYIYISGGSDQHTDMVSYSISNKSEVSRTGIYQKSYTKYNQALKRVYTLAPGLSPEDIRAYNVANGIFTDPVYPGGYDSPYHGDYEMNHNFKLDPKGNIILTYSGEVFGCKQLAGDDMKYIGKLDKDFDDVVFDNEGKFIYAISGKEVYAYDSSNFNKISTCGMLEDGRLVVYGDDAIIVLNSKNSLELIKIADDKLVQNTYPLSEDEKAILQAINASVMHAQNEDVQGSADDLSNKYTYEELQQQISAMQYLFENYDISYKLVDAKIISIEDDTAIVDITYEFKKIAGEYPFENNRTKLRQTMCKENGKWKFWDSEILESEAIQ